MHPNAQLIQDFYSGFQRLDYAAMQACYADNATFSDPVFTQLNATQARAMWQMFCRSGAMISLEFGDVTADDHTGSAWWRATYRFSATGRLVVNYIEAKFEFENGKIARHTDTFDFYRWARQAFGPMGWLLGWTGFLKNKVRQTAMGNLEKFQAKNP